VIQPAAREAWRAIQALMLGGAGHNRLQEVCQEVDLTPAALKTLLVLSAGPRAMRDLVGAFRFDPSYMTNVVDLLERHGMAQREPHPTDRRAKTVVVTEEGQRVVARARELMAIPPASFGVLSPVELDQLQGLLLRIVDAEPGIPDAMRPSPPAPPTPPVSATSPAPATPTPDRA
jgi:DNA-binding MarR family transcriptional regulator